MARILVLCVAVAALGVMAQSKSLSPVEEPCYECAEETYERIKRNAPAILNSISNLVNGILDTNWRYITQLRAQRLAAQRPTVIIGPGHHNNNRVMFNGGGWDIQ